MRTLILILVGTLSTRVNIKDLKGNIYKEELGSAFLFDEEWTLLISINSTGTEKRVNSIQQNLEWLRINCRCCPEDFEIITFYSRFKRLKTKEILLHNILGKRRYKRELFNFVGDFYLNHFLVP